MVFTFSVIQIDLHGIGFRDHFPALFGKCIAGIIDHRSIVEFQSQFDEALVEERIPHIPDYFFIQHSYMNGQ